VSLSTSSFRDPASHRRFVLLSLSLLLVAVGLNFLLCEVFARKVIWPRKCFQLLELKREGKTFRTVSLGTSHTAVMNFDYPGLFNFGLSRTFPSIMYFKMKHLAKTAPNVQALLLEADTHLFYSLAARCDKYQHSVYIDEDVDPSLGNHPRGSKGEFLSLKEEIAPTVYKQMAISLHRLLTPGKNSSEKTGRSAETEDVSEDVRWDLLPREVREQTAISRLKHFSLYDYEPMNPLLVEYYEKTIRLALKQGMKVIFIRYPLTNEFLAHHNPQIEGEVSAFLDALSKKYGIPILDYRRVFVDRQDLFSNQDHCNGEGKKVLRERILADLRGLGVSMTSAASGEGSPDGSKNP